jgi:hypothetical protein
MHMAAKSNGLTVLATALANAYATVQESGGLLDNVCKVVATKYKGEGVPDSDAEFIVDEVSRIRSWSASAAKVRKSEMRAILSVYSLLPDAMAKLRGHKGNTKPVTFDAGLKLARALKKGSTITQAVAAYVNGSQQVDPADRSLDEAKASARTHVKRILQHTALPIKFRNALREACENAGIVL